MPAYNESDCIEKVVNSWMEVVNKHPGSEMMVLNDGSKDDTEEKLAKLDKKYQQLIVVNKKNQGHGPTIMRGYKAAAKSEHGWVFQTDSDDQFKPVNFEDLWKIRYQSDFILGHRQNRQDALHRIIISKMIHFTVLLLYGVSIKDVNIPYRLMKREYLARLLKVYKKDVFAPNIFYSIIAAKDGLDFLDIPITHEERKTGNVSIVRFSLIKACMRGFVELLRFRINLNGYIRKINR
ncbi:glycosyltransferase family 2 protein [Candidatus Woesearchaeota archaeon]|nr:glycosyltransferase family 2 protein [Candidatus Woesearchaeota archaeon]